MSYEIDNDPVIKWFFKIVGFVFMIYVGVTIAFWARRYGWSLTYDQNAHNIVIAATWYWITAFLASMGMGLFRDAHHDVWHDIGEYYAQTIFTKFTDLSIGAMMMHGITGMAWMMLPTIVGYEFTGGFTFYLIVITGPMFGFGSMSVHQVVKWRQLLNNAEENAKWKMVRGGIYGPEDEKAQEQVAGEDFTGTATDDDFGFNEAAFDGGGSNQTGDNKPDDNEALHDTHMPPKPRQSRNSRKNTPSTEPTALDELNAMIGLDPVKEQISRLRAKIIFDQKRKATGAAATSQSMHMVFTGNPGTGKTTVARIVGKIFNELGVLEKATVHEVSREDLIAEYVGHTAPKTAAAITKALDGVLFIDEAYSLATKGTTNDFGREAIETLLKEMENNRDRLVVIVAGYQNEMQMFLNLNPGLKSRFKNLIDFPDYSPAEMYQIFQKICVEQAFTLEPTAGTLLFYHLAELYKHRDTHFGNGRDVRNIFETCVSNLAIRTQDENKTDEKTLSTFTAADIPVPDTLKSGSKSMKLWALIQDPRTNSMERNQAIAQMDKENKKSGKSAQLHNEYLLNHDTDKRKQH